MTWNNRKIMVCILNDLKEDGDDKKSMSMLIRACRMQCFGQPETVNFLGLCPDSGYGDPALIYEHETPMDWAALQKAPVDELSLVCWMLDLLNGLCHLARMHLLHSFDFLDRSVNSAAPNASADEKKTVESNDKQNRKAKMPVRVYMTKEANAIPTRRLKLRSAFPTRVTERPADELDIVRVFGYLVDLLLKNVEVNVGKEQLGEVKWLNKVRLGCLPSNPDDEIHTVIAMQEKLLPVYWSCRFAWSKLLIHWPDTEQRHDKPFDRLPTCEDENRIMQGVLIRDLFDLRVTNQWVGPFLDCWTQLVINKANDCTIKDLKLLSMTELAAIEAGLDDAVVVPSNESMLPCLED